MKKYLLLCALALAGQVRAAQPDYLVLHMEVDVGRPAAEVWAKVGGYCDISAWLNIDCKITSGDGGVGTVRALGGGRVTEVLVGRTDLSYGYTQPPHEGQFYNLYHGFMEARPVTATTSKLVYTLMMDESNKDAAAREADRTRYLTTFQGALQKMKALAEGSATSAGPAPGK